MALNIYVVLILRKNGSMLFLLCGTGLNTSREHLMLFWWSLWNLHDSKYSAFSPKENGSKCGCNVSFGLPKTRRKGPKMFQCGCVFCVAFVASCHVMWETGCLAARPINFECSVLRLESKREKWKGARRAKLVDKQEGKETNTKTKSQTAKRKTAQREAPVSFTRS